MWYLIAPNFREITQEGDTIDLLKVLQFKGLNPAAFSTVNAAQTTHTQIQVRNGNTYDCYYFINNGRRTGDPNTGSLTGWGAGTRTLVNSIPVTYGHGFWIHVLGADVGATVTVAGEVYSQAEKSVDVGDYEWKIICNPFPTGLKFSNIKIDGLIPAAFSTVNAAQTTHNQIQVRKGNTYDCYYYLNNGRRSGDPNTGSLTGWGAGTRTLVSEDTVIAEPAEAFWFHALQEGTLTFVK